jgi:hypothetical protein
MLSKDLVLLWQQALDQHQGDAAVAWVRFAELLTQASIDYAAEMGDDLDYLRDRWGF